MLPLEGIRVLDLSLLAPGPFCTMVLGDLGADVLRIEQPADATKASPPWREEEQKGRESAFQALNRNKRSIGLNLKREEARKVLYQLAEQADVMVEGFRPGVAGRLGVDYRTVRRSNPRIIYCSISGYGQDGPYRRLPGHDLNYISVAGALSLMGPRDGPPVIPYNLLGDYGGGGLQAAVGILAALLARQTTGRGQYLDLSITDAVVYLMASVLSKYFGQNQVPLPGRSRLNGGHPFYAVYACRDGKYLSVACLEPKFYARLCRALELEDLAGLQNEESRYPDIEQAFARAFRSRTRDQWWEVLRREDLPVARVHALEESVDDPQLRHRNMIVRAGTFHEEAVPQVGIPFKFSETPVSVRRPGSAPGEDTQTVLRELGYTEAQVDRLRRSGAIG